MTGSDDSPWWASDQAGGPGPDEPAPGTGGPSRPWDGIDPQAQAAQVLGTVAQEAGRLLVALQERLASPAAAAIATGSAECQLCPVCRAIAALRTVDPDAVERLTEAATVLVASVQQPQAASGDDTSHEAPPDAPAGDAAPAGGATRASRSGKPTRPRTTKPTRPRESKVQKVELDDE